MRAVLTGADGSCAHYMAQHLAARGVTVAPMSRRAGCDMRDLEAVCAVLDRERPDAVFHLASVADVKASFDDQGSIFRNNIEIALNLFEACRKVGLRPVIVNVSTSEIYGQPDRSPISEDFPIAPLNPYAVSKAGQDLLGQMYAAAYRFPVATVRGFGYVNPLRAGIALSTFAKQIAEIEAGQRQVLEHGNLDSVRTFADVRDIARAYALAAELGGGVFNIGAEYPVSIQQCLNDLIAMARTEIPTRLDPARVRPTDVTRIIPDCTRFRRATGWEPVFLLKESLAWLLDHYRAQVSEPKLRAVS